MNIKWKDNESSPMTWYKAKELSGEWELPTLQQLQEAFDNNTSGFNPKYYWTRDEEHEDSEKAWFFDFRTNESEIIDKNFYFFVRFCKEIK